MDNFEYGKLAYTKYEDLENKLNFLKQKVNSNTSTQTQSSTIIVGGMYGVGPTTKKWLSFNVEKDKEINYLIQLNIINSSRNETFEGVILFDDKVVSTKLFIVSNGSELSLNMDKIKEDEKFDGYYSIVTSEENLNDLELRNIYRGLSKIEETFKITKSEFNARPINVRLEDHIDAHFLICFIGLVIIRILQAEVSNKYTLKNLLEKMKNFKCTHTAGNLYKFIGYKPEIQYLNRKLQINLDMKYNTREEIKKILKY